MAFSDGAGNNVDPSVRNVIMECNEDLGWDVKIVDEEQHNDGIVDKVISLINSAKFVIAELTYQKSGVYYEAGYALGRGLPVIHIVKKEELEKCHFDVKHLNLIVWSSLEDLKEKLRNRILATIGKRLL